MSIALMTQAFKAKVTSTQKLVLLALCDCANDQGECYPSVTTLAEKCSAGERTVQEAISVLAAAGHLRREYRKGRATVYWMTPHSDGPNPRANRTPTPAPAAPHPRSSRTPADPAPPRQPHHTPAAAAPPPPQIAHPRGAAGAPRTINEPSIEPSLNRKPVREGPKVADLVAAGFDEETAADFIAHKAKVKAPLTARAWDDHLRESAKAGWSPCAAAVKVMAKSWKGFEAKYVTGDRQPASTADRNAEAMRLLGFATTNTAPTEAIDANA